MKLNAILVCCVMLGTALTACKGRTPTAGEGESQAAGPADTELPQAAAPTDGKPVTIVRNTRGTPVEADTSAPANVSVVPADAEQSESGLAWVVLKESTGEAHPAAGDMVSMNFIGWTAGGKLIDESLTDGRPAAIGVPAMFAGLAEGVQSMVAGEKRRFWIPGDLAFGEAKPGETPAEDGPPRGMVVYDVELLRFRPPPPKRYPPFGEAPKPGE